MAAKYSGISYVIDNSGNNPQFADKITTVNDCDYNLLDVHRVDWNNSYLVYGNKEKINLRYIEGFFELDNETNLYKRYTGSEFESKMPNWFNTGYIKHSGEILDVNDYLCYITSYAMQCIDSIIDSLSNLKTVLRFNKNKIEELGGKIDSNLDVYTVPIKFTLKPNQNSATFVGKDKFYSALENRIIIVDFHVYSIDGNPISDINVFEEDPSDPNNNTIFKTNWESLKLDDQNGILNITQEPQAFGSSGSVNISGYFRVTFTLTGWAPKKFRSTSLDLKLMNRFDKNGVIGYESENYVSNEFVGTLNATDKYQKSSPRTLTLNVYKAQNDFTSVFINDEEYIFIPENFFIKPNEDESDPLLSKFARYHRVQGYAQTYLIKFTDIPNSGNAYNLDRDTDFADKDGNPNEELLSKLIPVANFADEGYRVPMQVGINSDITFEVYPKFFGFDTNNGVDASAYDAGEVNDQKTKSFKELYQLNIDNINNNYMIPLFDSQRVGTLDISAKDCDSVNGTTNKVCTKCERTINGKLKQGFKFTFNITTSSGISDLSKDTLAGRQTDYVDIYFGTTATKFVGTTIAKMRLQVINLYKVYLVDHSRPFNYDSNKSFQALIDQIKNPTIYQTSGPNEYYGKNDSYLLKSSTFKESSTQYDNTIYTWDLEMPILSYLSWKGSNNTNAIDTSVNDAVINAIMPTLLSDREIASVGNKLVNPLNRNPLPAEFYGTTVKPKSNDKGYVNGFPKIKLNGDDSDAKNGLTFFSARTYYDETNQYQDFTKEIEIDYASTYQANKEFIDKCNDEFKKNFNNTKTDKEKGEILCSYFCGIITQTEKIGATDTTIKYLYFIRPTIPINEEYYDYDKCNNEWEDYVKNNREERFKLCLIVPKRTTSVARQLSHYEMRLNVYCNILRADKTFAGWARKSESTNNFVAKQITMKYNDTDQKYSTIINTDAKAFDPKYPDQMVQTRISSKSEIVLRNEEHPLDKDNKPLTNINIYKVKNNNFDTQIYCKLNNDYFTFYSSLEEVLNPSSNSIGDSIKYTIDIPIAFKLYFCIYGDDFYRGYCEEHGSYRDIDVTIFRNELNKFSFLPTLQTTTTEYPSTINEKNIAFTIPISSLIIQNITGETNDTSGTTFKAGQYIDMISGRTISISKTELNALHFDPFSTHFFSGEGFAELPNVYGENWRSQYLKVSVTAALTGGNSSYPANFMICKNYGLSQDSMMMFIDDTDKENIKLIENFGFNKFYQGDSSRPINEIITYNGSYIDFSKLNVNVGQRLGLIIAMMLPMTNRYKGSLYVMKLDFVITA